MSLVDQSLPAREASHSSLEQKAEKSYMGDSMPRSCDPSYTPPSETYDHAIFDEFYMDDRDDVMAPSPKRTQKDTEPPALPARSALRASKLLDSFTLKLPGQVETTDISQATPHDFYFSSEEDASSSADDFSDYDFESDTEEATAESPFRRRSHEDTARVVSVIFSGKPSIVDLSAIRRSISPSSLEARRRAASAASSAASRTVSSASFESLPKRASTADSSISSIHAHLPPRKTSMITSLLTKQKKPTFLRIDPYANGSSYSLEPSRDQAQEFEPPKTPKTPTALLQGVSRTFSLMKKRSRPNIGNRRQEESAEVPPLPSNASELGRMVDDDAATLNSVRTTQSRVTYGDIMRLVKRNPQPPSAPQSMPPPNPSPSPVDVQLPIQVPTSPSPVEAVRRPGGLLGNFAARRRSIKVTGRLI